MITDQLQVELEKRLAAGHALTAQGRVEGNLADALQRNRELKAELLRLHRPRKVAGGQVRCTECAVYVSGALRRMGWPCRTARALGVST